MSDYTKQEQYRKRKAQEAKDNIRRVETLEQEITFLRQRISRMSDLSPAAGGRINESVVETHVYPSDTPETLLNRHIERMKQSGFTWG